VLKFKVAVGEASQAKTNGEAALIYAMAGFPVVPCNWRPDATGKIDKRPLVKGGVYAATVDLEQVRAWWTKWPLALIGAPMGRRTGIWAVDVDAAGVHAGNGLDSWTRLEIEHDEAVTRTHRTGTGGVHRIYLWNPDRPVGCPVECLPQGMEVKGEGGYVIFPPSPYELGGKTVTYTVLDDIYPAAAPTWLYDLILGERQRDPRSSGAAVKYGAWDAEWVKKKLDYFCDLVRTAVQHEWDKAACKVFKFGKWVGGGAMDPQEAFDAILKAARANPTAPPDYAGDAKGNYAGNDSKVKRIFWNGVAEPEGPFGENAGMLDDFRAYMPQHNYIFVPARESWPASSVNSRIPPVDKKLKASTWLDQNRSVEQMTWAPGKEMLIHNRLIAEGGWIEKAGVTCFNLYRPPTIKPGNAAQAGRWLDHVFKVFGREDGEHIIKWCAQRVQHPEVKLNHALVLGSDKQGIGKDVMLEPVKRAVGHWNFGDINAHQLLGRFNGFLKNTILRISEARDLGDINRYQFYDHTKAIIAAPPDVLRVDEKHLREYTIMNVVGVIITTNYKINGIFLPAEDRRHYVAWSNREQEDFESDYWDKLFKWYDAGGDADVAAYLMGVDLAGFDPKAPPPKTQAFWDIVDANRAPEDMELADVLDALGNPAVTTKRHVVNEASLELGNWLQDRKNSKLMMHRFFQCGYEPLRNPHRADGLWIVSGTRQVVYGRKDLSLRERLIAANNLVEMEQLPDHLH
jgi:hypothetical protein